MVAGSVDASNGPSRDKTASGGSTEEPAPKMEGSHGKYVSVRAAWPGLCGEAPHPGVESTALTKVASSLHGMY